MHSFTIFSLKLDLHLDRFSMKIYALNSTVIPIAAHKAVIASLENASTTSEFVSVIKTNNLAFTWVFDELV